MIAQVMQTLIENKRTTATEIAELAGVAPSTVYRWIKGDSEPTFNTVRLLVRHLPDRKAQEAILSTFMAGTDWQFFALKTELDVNHDGRIDEDDALDACIESVRAAGKALAKVRGGCGETSARRPMDADLIQMLTEVIRHCKTAQQILIHMTEHRKPARVPVGT